MARLSGVLFLTSLIILLVSFWNRNSLSNQVDLEPRLNDEPIQSPITKTPFSTSFNGVDYVVEPQYDYTLYGLVVSYRHHDGDSMLHKSWNDHLNMIDVCVIWGETALSPYLNRINFWNGQFTCNVRTRDSAAWASFNMNELSNNHLISSDEYIRERVKELKVGDQIRIRGWLSSYGNKGGVAMRGTSTVRDDTGNGACETIYVKEFSIIKKGKNLWRALMYCSLFFAVLFLVLYFAAPHDVISREKNK